MNPWGWFRVAVDDMKASVPLLTLGLLAAAQRSEVAVLREALDTLRGGRPGQAAFSAAAEHLPRLIASDSPWFVEGGAYVAGLFTRKECVPALLAALERENRRPAEGADLPKRAVLDALVRLEATVPTALLTQRLEESSLAVTYLLLMRGAEGAGDGLLALFDAAPLDAEARWAAACALVEARDERIAGRLLAGEWELDVTVRDAGSTASVVHGGAGGGALSSHEPWPPRVRHELVLPEDAAPLSSIQHVRTEGGRFARAPSRVGAEKRFALRVRLIDVLLGEVEERGLLQRSESLVLEWAGAEAFVGALRSHCQSLLERLARVAKRLASLGSSAQEISDALTLRVAIHDLRSGRPEPLPSPPEITGVVYVYVRL